MKLYSPSAFGVYIGRILVLLWASQYNTTEVCCFSLPNLSPIARPTSLLVRNPKTRSGDFSLPSGDKSDYNKVGRTRYLISVRGGSSDNDYNMENNESNRPNQTLLTSPSASAVAPYYLVWSPGFAKKFGLATTFLLVVRSIHLSEWDYLRFFAQHSSLSGSALFSHPSFVSNLVLPLLSSSCCALQLLINAVSTLIGAGAGCVGFNSFLGPVRPYLMAVLLVSNTTTGIVKPTLGSIAGLVLRSSIAFLPELVFWRNEVLRSKWRNRRNTSDQPTATSATPAPEDGATGTLLRATLVVDVPSMGCVACINKIESSLRQCSPKNIDGATSWLNDEETNNSQTGKKGGRAKIEVRAESRDELDAVTRSIVGAIEDAGFRGNTVQSLDTRST